MTVPNDWLPVFHLWITYTVYMRSDYSGTAGTVSGFWVTSPLPEHKLYEVKPRVPQFLHAVIAHFDFSLFSATFDTFDTNNCRVDSRVIVDCVSGVEELNSYIFLFYFS